MIAYPYPAFRSKAGAESEHSDRLSIFIMPYNVYYLDDNAEFLDLVTVATQHDSRFYITIFTNPLDLSEAFNKEVPDALILDLNLGFGLTGTILAGKYRLDYPDLPIAVYTSYDTERAKEFIFTKDLKDHMTQVWNKSSINITQIGDHIIGLINTQRGKSDAIQK